MRNNVCLHFLLVVHKIGYLKCHIILLKKFYTQRRNINKYLKNIFKLIYN